MMPSRLAGTLWPANMLKSMDIGKGRSAAGEADRRGRAACHPAPAAAASTVAAAQRLGNIPAGVQDAPDGHRLLAPDMDGKFWQAPVARERQGDRSKGGPGRTLTRDIGVGFP
jgi:hypothetical protein